MNDSNDFFKDEYNVEMFENPKDIEKNNIERIRNEKEKRLYRKLISALSIFLFLGILLFFLFLSIIDKDQLVSESEKRTLAQRPEFSASQLFLGKWTTDYENYYSDNFPFRDVFISVSKKLETLLTRFSLGENGSVIVKVEKDENDFAGEKLTSEEDTDGTKQTTTKPTTTQKTTILAENNAEYANDKDAVVTSSILIANKRAMELFGYNQSILSKYASLVNNIAKSVGNNANVYSLIAPTSIEFYGTKQYRTGSHSQRDAIEKIYGMLDSNVKTVDAYSVLAKNTDKYIYFKTDHHWTARGAYCAYTAFCNKKNIVPKALEDYADQGRIPGDFLGTLYAQTKSEVLAKNPDYVEFFKPENVEGKIYSSPEMTDPMNFYVVARNVNSSNKYLAFIAGDQPLEKITTQNKNDKKIIVLKESYGNAFVPFLCNDYEEIYVLDPRKLTFNLNDFVVKNSIDDVLLINYAFGMSNPIYTKALGEMVK